MRLGLSSTRAFGQYNPRGCVANRGGLRHPCAHYHSHGHARRVPSRPPDHQLPIRHGHGVQRPNRDLRLFATVCKSDVDEAELGRECRHRRPVIMAAKAPGGLQDTSSGSKGSKRDPDSLSSNAAARTRNRCCSRSDDLRIVVCYGLRGIANGAEKESLKPWPSAKRPAASGGPSGGDGRPIPFRLILRHDPAALRSSRARPPL